MSAFYKQIQFVFSGHDIRFYIELRNINSFVETTYTEAVLSGVNHSFENFWEDSNLDNFRWVRLLEMLHDNKDLRPSIVWRFEDYQHIWRDVIGAFTGVSNTQEFLPTTENNLSGLSFSGARLYNKYRNTYTDLSEEELGKVRDVFLRQFPINSKETSGLSQYDKNASSYDDISEDDFYYINRMENVTVINLR